MKANAEQPGEPVCARRNASAFNGLPSRERFETEKTEVEINGEEIRE
jgi:hypothetical protein